MTASFQACEALKILSGNLDTISRSWTIFDLWDNELRQVSLASLQTGGDCPACEKREFPWLDGSRGVHSAVLCGRNSVQLSFPGQESVRLDALEERLRGVAQVLRNRFLLRFNVDDYQVTVFPDGRAIVGGTEDLAEARSVYAKYIGT